MITGLIAVLFLISMFASAGNGEWGSVAVGAVIVIVLLAIGASSRESDRAYNNVVDYWANGMGSGSQVSVKERNRDSEKKRGMRV